MCLYHRLEKTPSSRPKKLGVFFGTIYPCLAIYLARDGEKIVGLVRLVGDGFSSVFVQDLIVLPTYQRQGIGSTLIKQALSDYKDAYQVQLATEESEKTLGFYRSLGFEALSSFQCTGMIWVDRKKLK